MKQGDFTTLAGAYINRPGYSLEVLNLLMKHTGIAADSDCIIADVGAGTGKLTENLLSLGLNVVAVEPNDAMRAEGVRQTSRWKIEWRRGSGENTGLPANSVDWLLMGSSFHWVEREAGLNEFYRVLKPGGFFTALWNPRDIDRSPLHQKIEQRIHSMIPNLNRVSSGAAKFTQTLHTDLVSTGQFERSIMIEAPHEEQMSRERYLGAWRSVNDIQAQAGPERFKQVLDAIEEEISGLSDVVVPYKTRSWTVQRKA